MSSLIRPMLVRRTTYLSGLAAEIGGFSDRDRLGSIGQEQIFEKERGEVGAAAQPGLAIHGERLLTHGPLARLAKLGNFFVPQPLQLQQRNLALGRRQPPAVELMIDGGAQTLQHMLRL